MRFFILSLHECFVFKDTSLWHEQFSFYLPIPRLMWNNVRYFTLNFYLTCTMVESLQGSLDWMNSYRINIILNAFIARKQGVTDRSRAFVHGHTFLHSWSGPVTLVDGLLHGAAFLSNLTLVLFSILKGHLLNLNYNNNAFIAKKCLVLKLIVLRALQ